MTSGPELPNVLFSHLAHYIVSHWTTFNILFFEQNNLNLLMKFCQKTENLQIIQMLQYTVYSTLQFTTVKLFVII